MTKPRTGQSGNWDRERADRLQKDVERMQKDIERLTTEREWSEDRFPCDGVCVDAPEETCSRHGRNPADLWRIIGEVTAGRDAQTKRAERLERWYADALTMLDKSRRWKSIASLTAERDSLAARLALVEALAEAEVERLTAERDALAAAHARESEKVWKVEEVMDDIEGSDPTTWERLRDALSGSGADTSERETQHVMREPSMTDLRWTCSGCEWARSDAFTTAEERADSFATEHQPTDQEGK